MPGLAGAGLLVGRVRRVAAGVADGGGVDARRLPEHALGAPEAAHAERRRSARCSGNGGFSGVPRTWWVSAVGIAVGAAREGRSAASTMRVFGAEREHVPRQSSPGRICYAVASVMTRSTTPPSIAVDVTRARRRARRASTVACVDGRLAAAVERERADRAGRRGASWRARSRRTRGSRRTARSRRAAPRWPPPHRRPTATRGRPAGSRRTSARSARPVASRRSGSSPGATTRTPRAAEPASSKSCVIGSVASVPRIGKSGPSTRRRSRSTCPTRKYTLPSRITACAPEARHALRERAEAGGVAGPSAASPAIRRSSRRAAARKYTRQGLSGSS